ncbi:MAG: sigma-54-dependent Fis family transcriptional regulator [Spirochaetales bacterium]|nr:sigma-54-dependent Fis family transcriptional regulator [Spirochaetales bacterium]
MGKQHYPGKPVLLVDDEEEILTGYNLALMKRGTTNIVLCDDSRKVMELLSLREYAAIILDLSMPYITGQELIEQIKESYPGLHIIVVTGVKDINIAIECIQKGVYDYLVKPVEINRLVSDIRRIVELIDLKQEVKELGRQIFSSDIKHPEVFSQLITADKAMMSIFKYAEAIASSPKPLLVTGESGVGKELIAQAVHTLSRREGRFIPVNISGLDDNMFSDTLFGHKKGAYTGATSDRDGLIRKAETGTIFLDEIGDLEQKSQVKLLRLLQENQYYPLGSDKALTGNVRVIAATNADLKDKQQKGEFRKDLYFRLMTHFIYIPPLRERMNDIPLLVDHFIKQTCKSLKKEIPDVPDVLYTVFSSYHYPGNIRELESMIYNGISLLTGNKFPLKMIEEYIAEYMPDNDKYTIPQNKHIKTKILSIITNTGELPDIEDAEEYLLRKALERMNGNQSLAAVLLGMTPSTFSRHLKKFSIK